MRTSILTCLLVAALPALAQTAPAQPAKIQTLLITGQNTVGHDWRVVSPILKKALEDTGRFEVRVNEDFRGAGPETLAPYDLVVINYYENKDKKWWWGDRAQNALIDFSKSGKGVVIFHFSVAAFEGWTEYEQMCGGNWRPNNGHHSPSHDFTVDIKDATHPITQGLRAKLRQPYDELYANLKWQPAGSYHVLATAYDDPKLYAGKARQPNAVTDRVPALNTAPRDVAGAGDSMLIARPVMMFVPWPVVEDLAMPLTGRNFFEV